MKCANCDRDAFYIYQINAHVEIPYCGSDLPKFLEPRRKAGLLKTTEQLEKEKTSAIAILATPSEDETVTKSKKKKAAVEPSQE